MAIVEYRGGATPREIIARIERRNRKDELARTLHLIWRDAYDAGKTDAALKSI